MYMPEIFFQSPDRAFMRIQQGCQGRQRRLYSLDSHAEYAYTLVAIDKSEFREWFLAIVKISGYGL